MKSVRGATGLVLAVFMVLLVLPFATSAQTPGGITISPSSKELIIGPGLLEARTTVDVRNNTNQDLTAQIRLVDIEAKDEFGGVSFSQLDGQLSEYSLAKWMSLPNGSGVKLSKNQTISIPVSIRNDSELSPGGHYGAAIVSVSTDQSKATDGVSFKQELASLIFIKKTGGETYGIQLESMKPENLPNIPEKVNLKFKGTGNVHVIPRGYIEVTDPKGTVVAKGIINPESTLVMPEKSRQFTTLMQPVSEAKAKGEYKLTAYYRYEGIEKFESQSLTFKRSGISFLSTGIILLVVSIITGVATVLFSQRSKQKRTKK